MARALEALDRASRRRALAPAAPLDGMAVERDGRRLVNFASNDYLGLARDPRLAKAAARGAALGTGAASSRLVSGTLPAHRRLERALCALKGTGAALAMGPGFQTNAGALAALLEPEAAGDAPLVLADRQIHASMHDGLRLAGVRPRRFRHNDLGHLQALLEQHGPGASTILVLTESVFSMDGDRADLPGMVALARRHGAFLYVDEAHATGVLGPAGAGLCAEPEVRGRVDLVMGTFSKALGGYGAFAATDPTVADWLVNRCRSFLYSTALPPSMAAAALKAVELLPGLEPRRERALRLAERLRAALARMGIGTLASSTQIVPAVFGADADALAAARILGEHGVLAPAIRPPTVPEGTARLRFSVSAGHTDENLDQLLQALAALGRVSA
jgi:8-amino-7-oxononanoate synthase